MKKIFLLTLAMVGATTIMANYDGAGYYRVENYRSKRYVSVIDNRGSIDFGSTNADLQAIKLDSEFELAVSSDPASVIYIQPEGNQYNFIAQSTSVYEIIQHYVSLSVNGSSDGQNLYMCYGTYNGVTKYLGDQINSPTSTLGKMSVNSTGDSRKWYIKPITSDGDNYFGAAPTVSATSGDYKGLYSTLYAAFPFSAYSSGVKLYTVDKAGTQGQVTLKELSGVVPANTPVIVKCVGENSSDNRLNLGGDASEVSTNDNLKGVFFNCDLLYHINRVEYDADTMRVLGVCEDGSLGFVTADIDYIPANTIYLTVPAGSPAEYKVVDDATYVAGVDEIGVDPLLNTVYTLTGVKVADGISASELRSLPKGIYIVNGKKLSL